MQFDFCKANMENRYYDHLLKAETKSMNRFYNLNLCFIVNSSIYDKEPKINHFIYREIGDPQAC